MTKLEELKAARAAARGAADAAYVDCVAACENARGAACGSADASCEAYQASCEAYQASCEAYQAELNKPKEQTND